MEVKVAIKIVFVFCIGFYLYGNQINAPIYLEAVITDEIDLGENYLEKYNTNKEIVFSYGIESLGEINKFIFDKNSDSVYTISNDEYKKLKFSSIKELNNELWEHDIKAPDYWDEKANATWNRAINNHFKNITIVENDNGNIRVYKNVYWKKQFFVE